MRPVYVGVLRRLQLVNYWLIAQVALTAIRLLRLLPPHRALDLSLIHI